MVYGESCSGKTTLIQTLYDALMRAREDEIKFECEKLKAKWGSKAKISDKGIIDSLINSSKPSFSAGIS